MRKIIKSYNTNVNIEKFNVEEFSPVERGEKPFDLVRFGVDEISVQDAAKNRASRGVAQVKVFGGASGQGSSGNPFSPSRPRLFSSYDDDGNSNQSFVETPFIASDSGSGQLFGKPTSGGDQEQHPSGQEDTFQEIGFSDIPEQSSEDVSLPQSQKKLLESSVELDHAQEEIARLKEELAKSQSEKENIQSQMDALQATIEPAKEQSRKNGYDQAVKELASKEAKQYEADRKDYMDMLLKLMSDAGTELKKLDDTVQLLDQQMPEIVVSYVKSVVGAERKINDKVITNMISSALENLKDLQQITFNVNPEDYAAVSEKFPQYGIIIDPTIPRGGVKVKTKVGDVDLSIDSWLASFEKQIYEQFTHTQDN